MAAILVLDPSRTLSDVLALVLTPEHNLTFCSSLPEACSLLTQGKGTLLIADCFSQDSAFMLNELVATSPLLLLLIDSLSARFQPPPLPTVEILAKPFHPLLLQEKVRRLIARAPLAQQHKGKEQRLKKHLSYPHLPLFAAAYAEQALLADFAVHIRGEKGTGKDRVASALHTLKGMGGRFLPMAASAFHPYALAETVAREEKDSASLFVRAGLKPAPTDLPAITLYLKDVENLSPEGQTYLLSLLEEGGYQCTGGFETRPYGNTLPLWVLSSSCSDLRERMYQGEFSTQLYYFLTVFTLYLPSLQQRKGEMAALVEYFAGEVAERLRLGKVVFTEGAIKRLQDHLWFGNVAELEAVITRTLAFHRKSRIEAGDLLFGHESVLPPLLPLAEAPSISASVRPAAFLPPLTAIIGELAHELKNPMVTLKTFAHYVNRAVEDEEFRNKFSLLITEAVDRMDGALERVLEFSRLAGASPSPKVDLRALMQEVVRERKGFYLEWPEGESLVSDACEEQIRFALGCLCDVIAKGLPPGQALPLRGEKTCLTFFLPQGTGLSLRYLTDPAWERVYDSSTLPLPLILAKMFIEKNGGILKVDGQESDTPTLAVHFPFASLRS